MIGLKTHKPLYMYLILNVFKRLLTIITKEH